MTKKLLPLKTIKSISSGFTLVELLVVMGILAILASLVTGGLRSAQVRGRDARRKSDLNQISEALELFFGDHGKYPSDASGQILACPYDALTDTGQPCSWGTSDLTDGNTDYFKTLPADPATSRNYYYRLVSGSNGQKLQLYANLENKKDKNCLGGDCVNPPALPGSVNCGSDPCNFSVTSPNTTPFE